MEIERKDPLIVAHKEYLDRCYWGPEAYEFYVYCHIANRFYFFKQPYMTTIEKMSMELNLNMDLLVNIINSLIENELISVSKVNGKTNCYAFEISPESVEEIE